MPHLALVGCTSGSGPRIVAAARRLGYRVTGVVPPGAPAPVTDHVLVAAETDLVAALAEYHERHRLSGVVGSGGASCAAAALAARALGLPGPDPSALAAALAAVPTAGAYRGPRYVLPVLAGAGTYEVVAVGELLSGSAAPMFPAPALLPWQRHRLVAAAVAAVRAAGLDRGAYVAHVLLTGQGPRALGILPGIGEPPIPELVAETTGTDLATAALHLATTPTPLRKAA